MRKFIISFLASFAITVLSISLTLSAQPTPTNLPETNAPATATPVQFCHVKYNVFVHHDKTLGVRVRLLPSTDGKILRVAKPADNPQRAIDLVTGLDGRKWWRLCSISGEYMSADPDLTIGVEVTPQPATPTRIATRTEVPQPTRTSTPSALGKSICIDYDNDQGLQHVCGLFPLNARVVSIEVVTREPAP